MRVLIAPDKFAGTLTAVQAAEAIATGWSRRAPADDLVAVPMADGGPGFVDVLHAALGGELLAVTVTGPLGDPVPATVLRHEGTAYVEVAQACGLHLVDRRDPERATTVGAGELLVAALHAEPDTIVVGLGGSATNDGGAGMLHALGAEADVDLTAGVAALDGIRTLDLGAAVDAVASTRLVAATDVDNPLLGMFGATNVYGAQKGLPADRAPAVDAVLDQFVVAATGSAPAQRKVADDPGAGAAGGLGFALFLLGADRRSGIEVTADAVGLASHTQAADLVITGEGAYDFSSRAGKVVYGVAEVASRASRPCIALAGRVLVGAREMRAMGIDSAYSMVDLVGEGAAMTDPAGSLAALAERTARTWSR